MQNFILACKSLIFAALSIVFVVLSTSSYAQMHKQHSLLGVHGMVLFLDSQQNIYVSHLPLVRPPHNHQIVYQISVAEDIKQPLILALADNKVMTLVPEAFDLMRLINQESFTINADIYQGHFERGGNKHLSAKVTLQKPVFTKPVITKSVVVDSDSDSDSENHDMTIYLAQLNERESVYLHKIDRQPGFDAFGLVATQQLAKNNVNNTIVCLAPQDLRHDSISKALKQCGLTPPIYLETQDFQ